MEDLNMFERHTLCQTINNNLTTTRSGGNSDYFHYTVCYESTYTLRVQSVNGLSVPIHKSKMVHLSLGHRSVFDKELSCY